MEKFNRRVDNVEMFHKLEYTQEEEEERKNRGSIQGTFYPNKDISRKNKKCVCVCRWTGGLDN